MPVSGVHFDASDWSAGRTNGTGLADIAAAGVKLLIAKAGEGNVADARWVDHKAGLLAIGSSVVKGAFWTLRRAEQRPVAPDAGWFYSPFPPPKVYGTTTYHGHSDWSVDFNRGAPGVDEGDWVVAPSPGEVRYRNFRAPGTNSGGDDGVSDILIEHAGRYQTLYTHMKNLQVTKGQSVRLGQRLGQVSTIGNTTGSHLHHRHYRRPKGSTATFGTPIKMVIQGKKMDASVGNSDSGHQPGWSKTGQSVKGKAYETQNPEFTGASQATAFVNALGGSPAGWFCAVQMNVSQDEEIGLTPWWPQLRTFMERFWTLAPGYPLFLFVRRPFWVNTVVAQNGGPINLSNLRLRGLWTIDRQTNLTQGGFAAGADALVYKRTNARPDAGGFAGFEFSKLLQYGDLTVASRTLSGTAWPGTFAQLQGFALGTVEEPDPDDPNDPNPDPDPDPPPPPPDPPDPDAPTEENLVPWAEQWTIRVDGLDLNDHRKYVTHVPELQSIAPGRIVLAQIDGDYPVAVRRQPAEGQLTFLVAMKDASTAVIYDERRRELEASFAPDVYHTLSVQVRGMSSRKSLRFMVEGTQPDFRTRTMVVFATAPKPVLT